MTEKAQAILQKLRQWQAPKQWKRLANPERRDRILNDFNQSTLDPVGPVGGDQGMTVLKEMNELQSAYDAFVKSLAPRADLL